MKANHLFYLIFFYFIYSTSVSSQGFINMPTDESFTTEYQDGRYWGYLIRDNIVVAACLSELEESDDYYQLSLVVDNQSGFNRNFLPDSIQGYAYTHDGKKVKTVDIYSFEEMQKKIRSKKKNTNGFIMALCRTKRRTYHLLWRYMGLFNQHFLSLGTNDFSIYFHRSAFCY